ncbi:MAG: sulfatase-like hydrolase/transferase, partial [Planctomycetota bacterium]
RTVKKAALASLAAGGLVFDRAYCESPICLPSRTTLLTGKRASHHGVTLHGASMRDGERTIVEAFAEQGYLTHAVGKIHVRSQVHSGHPESIPDWRAGRYTDWHGPYAGFNSVDLILGHSNALLGHYGAWLTREHRDRCHLLWEQHWRKLPLTCGQGVYDNDIPEDLHATAWCADRAEIAMQHARDTGKPFFLHVGFPDPHWPINPPPRWLHRYDNTPIPPSTPFPNPTGMPKLFGGLAAGTLPPHPYDGGFHLTKDRRDVEAITRAYWGAISFIDHHVGRMLASLEHLGLADNTLVVFTSDHGEFMGDHGLMTKGGFPYESLVRVPFLVRFPRRLPVGARRNGLLSFLDIPATLAGLCGFDPGLMHDGVNQADAWRDGTSLRRDLDITHFSTRGDEGWPDLHTLITDDGWKLTHHAGENIGQLYHLPSDPNESNNRWALEPAVRERLLRQLLDRIIQGWNCQAAHDRIVGAHGEYHRHVMSPQVWGPEMDAITKCQATNT